MSSSLLAIAGFARPADDSALAAGLEDVLGRARAWLAAEGARAEAATATAMTAEELADISAARSGDGEAFARIVQRHEATIAGQMWRLARDRRACEELVHDVFVEAYFSLHQFRAKAPLVHWLRRIATRVGYRWCQQQETARRRAGIEEVDRQRVARRDENSLEAADLAHHLLQKLSARDRLVMTLIYLEGCTVREAAELAGWSVTMTKVQAHRARKKLARMLAEENK